MTSSKLILTIIKLASLVVITVLITTNPGTKQYEQYASESLNSYLKEEVCEDVTDILETSCSILIDIARPQLKMAIAQSTKRSNFLAFSIYNTDLSISNAIPEYEFATIGIMNHFFTYQADRVE